MLAHLASPFVRIFQRWMPDALIFAALLSMVTLLLAVTVADAPVLATIDAWGGGFWSLLSFMAQIAMTLVAGHALAHTRAVRALLHALAHIPRSASAAYALVCFVAAVGSLLSWSVGLIVGALVAKATAVACHRRGLRVHYPLLVASAYAGFVIWHQGLSSSIGLLIATPHHFLEKEIGIIPVSSTLFSAWNILTAAAVLATLPLVMMLLRPSDAETVTIPAHLLAEEDASPRAPVANTPAARLEGARLINFLLGGAGVVYLVRYFVGGGSLDLNVVNFTFLIAGILLADSPIVYVRLVTDAGRTLGPILVQYPFYAGIMGMMVQSGLARIVAGWFVGISSAHTLPLWSFVSGGLLNLFIPSGGGQWAVQGPIMVDAARQLGADIPKVAMGVAMGDQWTNMVQPFWTIPALAIAGLHVRDVMGYCVIAFLWSGLVFSIALLLA